MQPYHSMFRAKAIEEYKQRQEKDVLPHFIPFSLFIFLYVLLFLFLITGSWALWREAPLFITGSGVVLSEQSSVSLTKNNRQAIVLFLPAKYASQIHRGAYAHIEIVPTREQLTGVIQQATTGIVSPEEARQRYGLDRTAAQAIAPSSIAVTIIPATANALHLRAGTPVSAQIQISSQRILSLLLGW